MISFLFCNFFSQSETFRNICLKFFQYCKKFQFLYVATVIIFLHQYMFQIYMEIYCVAEFLHSEKSFTVGKSIFKINFLNTKQSKFLKYFSKFQSCAFCLKTFVVLVQSVVFILQFRKMIKQTAKKKKILDSNC